MAGTEKSTNSIGTSGQATAERKVLMAEDAGRWFEERFFDPDHPLDGDWLSDAESGILFTNGTAGHLNKPRTLDVNERIIHEARGYMDRRGLSPCYRPMFKIKGGRVRAIGPDGSSVIIDHSLYWEVDSGFSEMIDGLLNMMLSGRRILLQTQTSHASEE